MDITECLTEMKIPPFLPWSQSKETINCMWNYLHVHLYFFLPLPLRLQFCHNRLLNWRYINSSIPIPTRFTELFFPALLSPTAAFLPGAPGAGNLHQLLLRKSSCVVGSPWSSSWYFLPDLTGAYRSQLIRYIPTLLTQQPQSRLLKEAVFTLRTVLYRPGFLLYPPPFPCSLTRWSTGWIPENRRTQRAWTGSQG